MQTLDKEIHVIDSRNSLGKIISDINERRRFITKGSPNAGRLTEIGM